MRERPISPMPVSPWSAGDGAVAFGQIQPGAQPEGDIEQGRRREEPFRYAFIAAGAEAGLGRSCGAVGFLCRRRQAAF